MPEQHVFLIASTNQYCCGDNFIFTTILMVTAIISFRRNDRHCHHNNSSLLGVYSIIKTFCLGNKVTRLV